MADGTLTLYDGTGDSEELTNLTGIVLQDWDPPVFARENEYFQPTGLDGNRRVGTRANNANSKAVLYVTEDDETDFWRTCDRVQALVESAHRNKGYWRYEPPNGEGVEYPLESIAVTDFPQKGVQLKQRGANITIEAECEPYGLLDWQTLVTDTALPTDGIFSFFNPGHADSLVELTLKDSVGNSHNWVEIGLSDKGILGRTLGKDLTMLFDAVAATGPSVNAGSVAGTNGAQRCTLGVRATRGGVTVSAPKEPISVRVRACDESEDSGQARIRMRYQYDAGEEVVGEWRSCISNDWCELDLGTIAPADATNLTILYEVEGGDTGEYLYVDYLERGAVDRWCRLCASGTPAPYRAFLVDSFVTNTGAISSTTKSITGATNASPIAITSASHGLTTGTVVFISGVLGNTAANGFFTITNTGTNTFTLDGSTGNGAYTSGGTAYLSARTGDSGKAGYSVGANAGWTVTAGSLTRSQATSDSTNSRMLISRVQGTSARASMTYKPSDANVEVGVVFHDGVNVVSVARKGASSVVVRLNGAVIATIGRPENTDYLSVELKDAAVTISAGVDSYGPYTVSLGATGSFETALANNRLGIGAYTRATGSNSFTADLTELAVDTAGSVPATLPKNGKLVVDFEKSRRYDNTGTDAGPAGNVLGSYLRAAPGANQMQILPRWLNIESGPSWPTPDGVTATLRVRPRVVLLGSP